jgi:hypothetical protein
MSRLTRMVVAAIALVALAAACTQNDGDGDAAAGEAAADTSSQPSGDDGSAPDDTTLTASFTGVTADTISLGYTQIDFDAIRTDFGVDLNFQNGDEVVQALVDELNERGGINGRRVEVTVGSYVPVGAASAEELCIRFTEDRPVFAVLGGFGGLAGDVNSCIAARHDTALVGGTWNQAQHEDATAPWLRPEMALDRRSVAFATQLGEHGLLDEHERIAILSSVAENDPFLPEVEAALEAGGTEVVLRATVSPAGGAAEARTLLERARTSGATAVYFSGLNPALYPAMADYDVPYFFEDATTTEQSLRDFFRGGGRLDVVSNGTYPYPYRDDPEMAACIDIVEARTDIVVADPNTLPDDEPNWWEAVSRACQHLRLFELAATAAGPELTNESFLQAAEGLGEVALPGLPAASFGPGKYDGNDRATLVTWDDSMFDGEGGWAPIASPYEVG